MRSVGLFLRDQLADKAFRLTKNTELHTMANWSTRVFRGHGDLSMNNSNGQHFQSSQTNTSTIGLLHPFYVKQKEILKEKGSLSPDSQEHIRLRWGQETCEELTQFLQSEDLQVLVRLVRRNPLSIAHPLIFWQILHLGALVHMTDEKEWEDAQRCGEDWCLGPDEQIIPVHVKTSAQEGLKSLLAAWVPKLLPGHTVAPVQQPPQRGKKPKWPYLRKLDLLHDFFDLLHFMVPEHVNLLWTVISKITSISRSQRLSTSGN
jgi:hypothetical protein